MKLQTLEEYYVEELKDLYDAERQLLKALPRMAKAASHRELRSAFERHLEQTEEQVSRLEEIFQSHGKSGRGHSCKGMAGVLEEGKEMMSQKPAPGVMDAGLIATAQKVEHYEIAGYGSTSTYAKLLGFKDDLKLLLATLAEEKETDSNLTKLAKSIINRDALEAESEPGRKPARKDGSRGQGRGGRTRNIGQRSSARATETRPRSYRQHRASGKSKGSDGQDGEAQPTKDLEEIRAWAEARGGQPARVVGTGNEKDPGLLRIDFPGYSGEQSLEHISWEEWYNKFQENNLTFLYQDKTKDGRESRFFKLVCMEEAKT